MYKRVRRCKSQEGGDRMHPISIVLAFAFLGSLLLLGVGLVGFGVWRLQRQMHEGNSTTSRTLFVSLDVFLVALGLVITFYGAMGSYRIIWGT
jgi:sulfite exporter TauE/SafE